MIVTSMAALLNITFYSKNYKVIKKERINKGILCFNQLLPKVGIPPLPNISPYALSTSIFFSGETIHLSVISLILFSTILVLFFLFYSFSSRPSFSLCHLSLSPHFPKMISVHMLPFVRRLIRGS